MKKIITLLFMLAMLATTASAAYDIDIDNNEIIISGTTAPNSTVIVAVLKPGDLNNADCLAKNTANVALIADEPFGADVKTTVSTVLVEGYPLDTNFEMYKKHFQHVTADANGAYSITLPVVQNATKDIAFLLVESYDSSAEGSIIYVPSEAVEATAKSEINALTVDVIEDWDFVFGLNTASSVYENMKNDIVAAIIKMKFDNSVTTFTAFSDLNNPLSFKSFFNNALAYYTRQTEAVEAINTSTVDSLKAILETYAEDVNVLGAYGGVKLNFAAAYNKYGYMNVNKDLVGVSYDNMSAFITAFNQVVRGLASKETNPEVGTPNNPTVPSGPAGNNSGGNGGSGAMFVPTTQVPKVEDEGNGGFTDIDQAKWAEQSIMNLVSRGIVNGMGDGTFNPNGNVTREQFVKMLMLSFNFQLTTTGGQLSDVDGGAWYAPYVNTAVELGIVKGISDTEFGIGRSITRQDLVTMIVRACEVYGLEISKAQLISFTDANEISNYAYNAVMKLAEAGIINGVTDGVFGPQQNATRAQVSVILDRIYNS